MINERQSEESYNLKFDASNLSSGVYFYKIIVGIHGFATGSVTEIKRMLLIK